MPRKQKSSALNQDASQHHHEHAHDGSCCSGEGVADELANPQLTEELYKKLAMVMMNSGAGTSNSKSLKQMPTKTSKEDYKFWHTQPVPDLNEFTNTENRAIEKDKKKEVIRSEPYSLPDGFVWSDINLFNDDELTELYDLLHENYVEDEDHLFRFDYSMKFLRWAMTPPGWFSEWHCGIRAAASRKLVGFIGAIPSKMSIHGELKQMVEINFLCVHKKLRSKRMAPVLIREITRRVNRRNIFQAIYTSGTLLPRPVSTCRYWHRPLDPKKLIECGFSSLKPSMTLQRTIKLYSLPNSLDVKLKPLTKNKKQTKEAHQLMMEFLANFKIHQVFDLTDFEHWFITRPDIVYSFVVETAGAVTDMCSFYSLPSTVMNSTTHSRLMSAYSFYNVSTTVSLIDLMKACLVAAKELKYDVFNALDLMENSKFLADLKFGIGDGNLQYYIYNWLCPTVAPGEIGVVLQ